MIPLNKNQFHNNRNLNSNNKQNDSSSKTKSDSTASSLPKIPHAEPELHSKSGSKAEGIIEYIFIKFSNSVRLIGPLFAFCLVMFVIAVANTAFTFIIPYWMKNFHFIFCFLYLVAIYLLFSILFNYFLAVLVKPGSLADIRNSKFYRKNDPLKVSTNIINFENCKLAENLKNFWNEEKKKTEASASQIKIRYKTNENSILTINGNENSFVGSSLESYNMQDDLNTLANLENSQTNKKNNEKRKFNDIKFNFDNDEAIEGVNSEDLNNYNKLMGNVGGCIYPKDQINDSLNNLDSDSNLAADVSLSQEEKSTNVASDNREDDDFIKKLDQKLENLETNTINKSTSNYINANAPIVNNINDKGFSDSPSTQLEKHESSIKKLSDCRYCSETKPLRSHHCTICDLCVLKMDHHCPWINNCVGQNNHRYFVLFLTHTLFGCLFVLLIGLPIIFNFSIKKTQECNFIFILCFAGTFLLMFFNLWNWFLILKGYTTIEFWSNQAHSGKGKLNMHEFFMGNWKENLFLVFGTKSLLQAVLVPSVRKLPYSGLEWTKMVYPSFQLEIRDLDEEQDLNILIEQGEENLNGNDLNFNCSDDVSNSNSKYLDLV